MSEQVQDLSEAERACQEACVHLGLRTPEQRAMLDERVRFLTNEAHMDLVPAIHWAEEEFLIRLANL